MSKLQTVYVTKRINAYGQSEYDIREIGTGYMVRSAIGRRDDAYEIAERIDAQIAYERAHGSDSLQTV